MDDAVFVDLVTRARGGDEAAVACLLRSFEPEVRMMVRHRLPRAIRSQFDSMDFVQDIWHSLFAGPEHDPVGFESESHFLAYLAGVARNKVLEEYRRRTCSKKYELAREEPLYVRRGDHDAPRDVAASDPTPSQEAQAGDRMHQLAAGRTPAEVQILELRAQGLTFEEIADRVGIHERSVRRVIDTIRARMEGRRWQ